MIARTGLRAVLGMALPGFLLLGCSSARRVAQLEGELKLSQKRLTKTTIELQRLESRYASIHHLSDQRKKIAALESAVLELEARNKELLAHSRKLEETRSQAVTHALSFCSQVYTLRKEKEQLRKENTRLQKLLASAEAKEPTLADIEARITELKAQILNSPDSAEVQRTKDELNSLQIKKLELINEGFAERPVTYHSLPTISVPSDPPWDSSDDYVESGSPEHRTWSRNTRPFELVTTPTYPNTGSR